MERPKVALSYGVISQPDACLFCPAAKFLRTAGPLSAKRDI